MNEKHLNRNSIDNIKMAKVEFNIDGSIKVPSRFAKSEISDNLINSKPSILITKKQISMNSPLKCELNIKVSKKIVNPEKIEQLFNIARGKFRHMSQLSIQRKNSQEYIIKIISGQYRCSWCEKFREYLDNQINVQIINRGSCSDFTKFKTR